MSKQIHHCDDLYNLSRSPGSYTVKPVLSDHSKIDEIKVLMTNGSLMKVESSILQYF